LWPADGSRFISGCNGVLATFAIEEVEVELVHLKVKINGFSWVFPFLVLPDLAVPLIVGTDFLVKTGLVLNMRDTCFYFRFAPNSHLSFLSVSCSNFCLQAVIGPDLSHFSGE
jgi:hypothetical protein